MPENRERAPSLMLVIRKEQVRSLSSARMKKFAASMVSHHRKVFPEWSEKLGADGLEEFVWHGIERAGRHGFESELDVARYLHVMQALGKQFDESPEYPWAVALLSQDLPVQDKMDRLRDAAHYEIEGRRIRSAR